MSNIIVTGGAGFIGSHFLNYIEKKTSQKIIILDNLTYAADLNNVPKSPQFEFVWCDISNENHINYIFDKYKPKKVFHFAAESHVDNSIKNYRPFLETNIIGTINLLNASLAVNIEKFHHISTDEVYGLLEYDDTELFRETTQINPRNPYSASKASSDHYVTAWNNTYDLPYIITRCSNNYGPHQHYEKLIPRVIHNALGGEKTYMYGGGHQIRDWLHVTDHCSAIWALEEIKIINDNFNIGGNCELKNIDVTKKILDLLGKSYDLIGVCGNTDEVYDAPYYRPGQDGRYGTDFSKLTEKTGWNPSIYFDDGLKNTVEWYLKKLKK
jgi:dTDP-glucose 4,6-dehydratase